MSEINYCKNLWEQYGKVMSSRERIGSLLASMTVNGGDMAEAARGLSEFEEELENMNKLWADCFIDIGAEDPLFIADWDIYQGICSLVPSNYEKPNLDRRSIKYGRLIDIAIHGLMRPREESLQRVLRLISRLPSLERLELYNIDVEDLSPLNNLKNLKDLTLGRCAPEKIPSFPGLEKLWFGLAQNTDPNSLARFRKLKSLNVEVSDGGADFSGLQGSFPDLTELQAKNVDTKQITDLAKLGPIRRMFIQELSGEQSLDGLANNASIAEIYVYGNKGGNSILDISALPSLPRLSHLTMQDLHTQDYEIISRCKGLTYLFLCGSTINDISWVKEIPGLKMLIIENTGVSDITNIVGCPDLEALNLGHTRVKDISPVMDLSKLNNLGIQGLTLSDEQQELVEELKRRNVWMM